MENPLLEQMKNNYIRAPIYKENRCEIDRYNLKSLQNISFTGMLIGILLTFLSLPSVGVLSLLQGYATIAAVFVIVYILAKYILPERKNLIMPFCYAVFIALLFVSIVMGTYWGRDTNATTFVMMLLVLPLFIIDRPIRINLLCIVMSIIFCLIDIQVKTGEILSLDLGNCCVFCLLSCILSQQSTHLKMRDIIAQKKLKRELELEKALIKSEAASKAKTEFFSRMSHDMRTPMNGILGMAILSEEENNADQLKENIRKMKESGEYLLDLINDTLDFQKIESGKLELEPEFVKCGEFLAGVLHIVEQFAAEKKVKLQIDNRNTDLDKEIRIDAIRMKQVLINILSNAIKFTPEEGRVKFLYECTGKEGNFSRIRMQIKDSGIGMSPEYIENGLYQPFSQEHTDVTTSYKSSGLGLSIAKKLIEMMDGTIEVKSELGVGTTFIIELKVEVGSGEAKEKEPEAKKSEQELLAVLAGKNILLVEDHPLNAEIACKILEKAGCNVSKAMNGKEGAEAFEESEIGYYDAVLMDIRMPVMNGLDSARTIRNYTRVDAKKVPIIAMTANAYSEDVNNSMEAGMNEHLAKPIEPQKLYETLAFYIANRTK